MFCYTQQKMDQENVDLVFFSILIDYIVRILRDIVINVTKYTSHLTKLLKLKKIGEVNLLS